MSFPISEHFARSGRHGTFYLASGEKDAAPIVFLHGWPELSISWRGQLPVFGALGFRAIAPDMRGYGRSDVPRRHEDFAVEHIVADMIALIDSVGAEKAIWVGHDWGAPVAWSLAQHYPERCHAVAALSVPYIPEGFSVNALLPLVNRSLYPEDMYPYGQWDYQVFYLENFARATAGFEADISRHRPRAVPLRQPGRTRQAQPHGVGARERRLVRSRQQGARPAARRTRDRRGGGGQLCRGALAQRFFRPRQLVLERRGERRLCETRPGELATDDADAVSARRL